MSAVLDASALLAFLQGEPGAALVEAELVDGSVCGALAWAEVAQRVVAVGRDWELVRALFGTYRLSVVPVGPEDADWAARRWRPGDGLSLSDLLSLALATRLGAPLVTAESAREAAAQVTAIR